MIGQRYVSPPKHGVQPTFVSGRADAEHVCRAWRVTMPVGVRPPGVRRSESYKNGKGVAARWCAEEAEPEAAGR